MPKDHVSFRIASELRDKIGNLQIKRKWHSFTDAILDCIRTFFIYHHDLDVLLQLFQKNAANLEITDEERLEVMKIVEEFNNHE
jgi:hypothetical protein